MEKVLFNPQKIIPAFDEFLGGRGLTFSAIAIGGAALSILGIIQRGTRDLDLLETEIPSDIQQAAYDFAMAHLLAENWLNSGPSSLAKDLPAGWQKTIQPLYSGQNLKLSTLARIDLIRSKLWAMCDRLRDIEDLIAMAPTPEELVLAAEWVKPLDGNKDWPAHVDINIASLRRRLGYA